MRPDVLEVDVIAAARDGARLGAEHEVLRRADAGAERRPLLDLLGRGRRLRTAGPDEAERVPHHGLGDRHAPHQTLERNQVRAVDRTLELRIENRRRRAHDLELLVFGRMVDHDVEHEAVELGFRQRIGAFELDRVLRREDVERLFELIRAALDGDAVLLHRFEQRRLRLRRRAVDFVGEDDVGEDRPGREHHLPAAGRRVFLDDVGAGDVGRHQVGRELDARELQLEHARQRVNQQRLGQPRHADDEAVPADEERQQHQLNRVTLTDDELLELRRQSDRGRASSDRPTPRHQGTRYRRLAAPHAPRGLAFSCQLIRLLSCSGSDWLSRRR